MDENYSRQLDARIDRVDFWPVELPRANDGEAESDYIGRMCSSVAGMHNVHATPHVRVASQTSPVELCDAFHEATKTFVHIKRHFASQTLSHLFNQGLVSADLLVRNAEFRRAVEAQDRSYLSLAPYNGAEHRVVYGIVGRWKGRPLAKALPFFAKVEAQRVINELEAMGYGVAVARIELGAPLMITPSGAARG